MKTVCLSAGHSLADPGAVYDAGTKENFLTMKLVELATPMLLAHGIGVLKVPDTLSLVETIHYINVRTAQINFAVEVHINADARVGNGVEAWHYTGSAASKNAAQCLVDALVVETGMAGRGVFDEKTNRYGKLGFVHDTNPLAVLVECGFIDNANDLKLLTSEKGRIAIAKGIARGILTAIGEIWNPKLLEPDTLPPVPPIPPSNPNPPSIDVSKYEQEIKSLKERLQKINELSK